MPNMSWPWACQWHVCRCAGGFFESESDLRSVKRVAERLAMLIAVGIDNGDEETDPWRANPTSVTTDDMRKFLDGRGILCDFLAAYGDGKLPESVVVIFAAIAMQFGITIPEPQRGELRRVVKKGRFSYMQRLQFRLALRYYIDDDPYPLFEPSYDVEHFLRRVSYFFTYRMALMSDPRQRRLTSHNNLLGLGAAPGADQE